LIEIFKNPKTEETNRPKGYQLISKEITKTSKGRFGKKKSLERREGDDKTEGGRILK